MSVVAGAATAAPEARGRAAGEPTPRAGEPVPFHATRVSDPAPARRLVLLSYNFPPSSAVGGLRWQKMAFFARERGWGIDVVCLDPSSLAVSDPDRLHDLPDDVRVYGVPDRAPPVVRAANAVRRWMHGVRATRGPAAPGAAGDPAAAAASPRARRADSITRDEVFAQPALTPTAFRRFVYACDYFSAGLRWARRAAALADRVVGPTHRAVVTSGPPHYVHEGGRWLARRRGLVHVMDMRDPFGLIEQVPEGTGSPVYVALSERYEARAVRSARLVTCNTELAARALQAHHPEAAARIICVMNGTDDEPMPVAEPTTRFVVAYAGAIYIDRTPRLLFRAARRVIDETAATPEQFGFVFLGPTVSGEGDPLVLAEEEGIPGYVTHLGVRPRAETLRVLASAAMLVSLPQANETAIPSKIFEHSQFPAWMLVMANRASATGLLLSGTDADVVDPSDVDALAAVLRDRYAAYARGVRPRPVGADGRFSRRRQAAILLDRLDALTGASTPG